ncbi:uncharacterized protein N7511_006918 [Penicillium nucicola]|uniref:uncharacterized protein n=1 Tax=Penicillium nucicola TaxID=1850975 RepID=UPI002544FA69|nr:uncharacterized protein N7511_006918 [Penicillium nucicola]KAJ5758224.1 hypothetical protein N7511_006918 [Penicillium nucicola]
MTNSESRVIIVGGGVFGLSTALWLARGGYKDVTIFDRCNFDTNFYNPAERCDGASADISKIFRATYGVQQHSQDLALEAREIWLEWNCEIQESRVSDLPRPLTPEDELLQLCGVYHLADGPDMIPRYVENLRVMEDTAPSLRDLQFIKGSVDDEKRAGIRGDEWAQKYHLFDKFKDGATNGFLDAGSGITLADKACVYARYLCQKAGVKFVLGRPQGELDHLIVRQNGPDKQVKGIQTRDGLTHAADLVVIACGPWTPAVLPEAHRSVEATMGTVMFIDIPEDRQDLREKFHPDVMPVWRFIQGEGEGGYEGGGFPITREGRLKFGFRARKVAISLVADHPTEQGIRISTPRTKYSTEPIDTVPSYGLELMKQVIGGLFPELAEIGFTDSRLCWYTDSIDNETLTFLLFVIDYVPGYLDTVFICTGGSGHGFKFLPILGKYVKNQLERVPDRFTPLWKWRTVEGGKQCNGLEEGEAGPREMSKLKLAKPQDFQFSGKCHSTSPGQL